MQEGNRAHGDSSDQSGSVRAREERKNGLFRLSPRFYPRPLGFAAPCVPSDRATPPPPHDHGPRTVGHAWGTSERGHGGLNTYELLLLKLVNIIPTDQYSNRHII